MSFVIGFILGATALGTYWYFTEHKDDWESITTKLRRLFNK